MAVPKLFRLALVAVALGGCTASAGRDFVRPADDALIINKTSYEDALKLLGPPSNQAQTSKNGLPVNTVSYEYAQSGAPAAWSAGNVTPGRSLMLSFYNGKLVEYLFQSSFAKDSTLFDDSNIARIEKGKTKGEDVIAWFGRPSGMAGFPVTEEKDETQLTYYYQHLAGGAFSPRFYVRKLIVVLNDRQVVESSTFSTSGQP
jgi:hypothetical protein